MVAVALNLHGIGKVSDVAQLKVWHKPACAVEFRFLNQREACLKPVGGHGPGIGLAGGGRTGHPASRDQCHGQTNGDAAGLHVITPQFSMVMALGQNTVLHCCIFFSVAFHVLPPSVVLRSWVR